MKLRLQSNSLRLRLKRGEVAQLVQDGSVEEVITFGSDQALHYRLQTSAIVKSPQAIFSAGEINVTVPIETAQKWGLGDDIGIEATQPAREGSLQILIEKDFACLNGNEAQNVDTFPNPLAGTPC